MASFSKITPLAVTIGALVPAVRSTRRTALEPGQVADREVCRRVVGGEHLVARARRRRRRVGTTTAARRVVTGGGEEGRSEEK
jgi:hypothetical protein